MSAHRFPAELAATSASVFRSRTDVAPTTLAAHFGYPTARATWSEIGHTYVDVDRYAGLELLERLLADRSSDTFCLNDGRLDGIPPEEQDRRVVGFLQAYFPVPGPFELPGAGRESGLQVSQSEHPVDDPGGG
ncbi:stealth conserved region 3 domain-containing protein [Kitasatospora sp. GP82]|uniref:stealth conserved region 3 domain-containing protein n=1 Tax=Kitasatospora sp. GP82 TaxID=3035089 RepID=UPI0024757035|nr:stealth conserved region 3 domain-containing protein [Kitasatospora sp. GP82]MDH6124186.1 hypothetical protein [Kitasatospora sp. GP82]